MGIKKIEIEINLTFLFAFQEEEAIGGAGANHSSLLSVFGLNATSPNDSYLPLIFGKFALI